MKKRKKTETKKQQEKNKTQQQKRTISLHPGRADVQRVPSMVPEKKGKRR